ncbi:aldo/keto reductase family protein [Tribonema minus]|uniref:Aldo/keto reductase family protein n=1 Tax=Tribonema minus TaxID=303371 RepID=A0A836CAZ3_9STRA|nr:aldo/keto reductase family protein [Tribonema minus]
MAATKASRKGVKQQSKSPAAGALPLRQLGTSDLLVSQIALGGLMFGLKTEEEQAHHLLNVAVDEYGVNFIDTSESYPRPMVPESFGRADEIVGSWLKGRDRASIILGAQVCGRSNFMNWLRKDGSNTALTPEQIVEAVDGSLTRLGTDYVDLLQIEWPDRYVGELGDDYYDYSKEQDAVDFLTQLEAMQGLITAGKVRHIGVCNETPYGIAKFLEHAQWDGMPRIASVQNSYNVLNRHTLELGVVEACAPKNGNVGIIAHTPLGGGVLTGKYIDQTLLDMDKEARLNKFYGYQIRYLNEHCQAAVKAYKEVADKHGVSLTAAALQWVYSRPFVASTVVGVTSEAQLRENLDALSVELPEELQQDMAEVFRTYREPTMGPTHA